MIFWYRVTKGNIDDHDDDFDGILISRDFEDDDHFCSDFNDFYDDHLVIFLMTLIINN